MAHRIKVTGYMTIDDEEFDDGRAGPLTEEANMAARNDLGDLEDLEFELAD